MYMGLLCTFTLLQKGSMSVSLTHDTKFVMIEKTLVYGGCDILTMLFTWQLLMSSRACHPQLLCASPLTFLLAVVKANEASLSITDPHVWFSFLFPVSTVSDVTGQNSTLQFWWRAQDDKTLFYHWASILSNWSNCFVAYSVWITKR